jgi:site-specific DNA-methyltransferase (adenine-specific)
MKKTYKLLNGDCLDKLKELQENSIDSIVTDPPYGLSFMGKKWDYDVPSQEIWEQCLRVLKPGGHLLAFAGSRTYHRMAVRIEDAGFDIRDQIMWIYGSGFPKSHNIGHKIDEYQGWGTALKPAHEPIVMARKPFKGSVAENVLEYGVGGINVDGCRIGYSDNDDPRIGKGYEWESKAEPFGEAKTTQNKEGWNTQGRFPANIIFECTCDNPKVVADTFVKNVDFTNDKQSDMGWGTNKAITQPVETTQVIHTNPNCPCYILDKQSGTTKSSKRGAHNNKKTEHTNTYTPPNAMYSSNNTHGDTGGASRFFYCPKASKKDRDAGVEYVGQVVKGRDEGQDATNNPFKLRPAIGATFAGNQTTSKIGANPDKPTQPRANIHPTVKPTDLMTYLIRLVTPKGGIVLDPFMGSGSTGKAAMREEFRFVGIEREKEYMEIAEQRIDYEYKKRKFF